MKEKTEKKQPKPPANVKLGCNPNTSQISLERLAILLGTDRKQLIEGILYVSRSLGGYGAHSETVFTALTAEQAKNNVNGLIKFLYGQLFEWCIAKISGRHFLRLL